MVRYIGGTRFVRSTEVVCFSQSPFIKVCFTALKIDLHVTPVVMHVRMLNKFGIIVDIISSSTCIVC